MPTRLTRDELAARVDHTLLKPEATAAEVAAVADEAAALGVCTVCVSPSMVSHATRAGVPVAAVAGFPSGKHLPELKAHESARAVLAGAVGPEDGALGACIFEYETAGAAGLYLPCSALPTATGGVQDVSALLSALAPNTTYANATETYRIDHIDEHGGVWGTWLRHPLITREMETYSRPEVFERWAKGTGAKVVG